MRVRDGVLLAEIIEERGERGELSPDARRRERAVLEPLAPANHVRAGDQTYFCWTV